LRAGDSIVIGQDDGGEAELTTSTGHLKGWHPAIKRSRAVEMEIDSDLVALGTLPPPLGESKVGAASGHVRYYKRRQRALRRGEDAGVYLRGGQ
jgi:hypothetical protein